VDNCGALLVLVGLAMVAIVIVVVNIVQGRSAALARLEAEQRFRQYAESWAAARSSENIDAFVRCGEYIIKASRLWQPHLVEKFAWEVYREVLQRLRKNPQLKPFALEIGRAAYSARRPGRELTIYDEQAIQNDIMVHSE